MIYPSPAIITRPLPATLTRRPRIRATSARGSITIPYDHALDIAENHQAALEAYCERYDLIADQYIAGRTPDGLVYVLIPGEQSIR